MPWRRTIVVNLAVQGLGASASFGVVAILARVVGPETQGEFAVFRSLIDFLVVLLSCGLPSGFVYVAGKGLIAPRVLARWSARGIPIFGVLGAAAVYGYLRDRSDAYSGDLSTTVLLLSLAVAAATFYALMRGIVLICTDGAAFAWLTAMPPIVLFALAVGGVATEAWDLAAAFACTWLASAIAAHALWLLSRKRAPAPATAPGVGTVLRNQSVHSFLQGIFQSGVVFGTITAMQTLGGTVGDIGQFTVASLAIVGPNLFVAMIAPLLFNRWTRYMTAEGRRRLIVQTVWVALGIQAMVLAGIPFSVPLLTTVFGEKYHAGAVAMTPLMLAIFPMIVTRVVAPALQATGDPGVVTVTWGLRLAAPWILLPLARVITDVVLWATLVTACGEYLALAAMLTLARRRARVSAASTPPAVG